MIIAALAAVGLVARAQTRPPLPQVVRAAVDRESPESASQRGRAVYERYGCAMCHGADGKGGFANPNAETDGQVPGVQYVAEGYTEAELARKILDGVHTVGKADPKGPRPPYRMPGWAGYMTEQEVHDLVQYLVGLYPESAQEKWR